MIKNILASLSWKIVALMLSGFLYVFAFAPYSFFFAAPLSIAGLIVLLAQSYSNKSAFYFGWAWGLTAFLPGLSWVRISISDFSATPAPIAWFLALLLVAVMAVYIGLFAQVYRQIRIRWPVLNPIIVFPVLWLILELVRSWAFTGFPWLLVGSSALSTWFAAWLPFGSVYAASFIIVAIVIGLVQWHKQKVFSSVMLGLVLVATFAINQIQWVVPTGATKQVSLVQGNIPQDRKWLPQERWPTVDKYIRLSQDEWQQDMIIWPEAALPILKEHLLATGTIEQILSRNKDNQSALITGLLQQAHASNRFYNGIYSLGNGSGQYYKKRLVLFGEYVPLEWLFRGIIDFFNLPMSTIVPGEENQGWLQAADVTLAPALCYEIAYPFLVRGNLVKHNQLAGILLTISNDAWFGRSIGPLQHAEIASTRALELGRPLLRATNTGVTLVADHHGKIIKQLPQFKDGVLRSEVALVSGQTFWAQWGIWSLFLVVLIYLFGGLATQFVLRKTINKNAQSAQDANAQSNDDNHLPES
jgi:apolipoprotein N-acyltransferase